MDQINKAVTRRRTQNSMVMKANDGILIVEATVCRARDGVFDLVVSCPFCGERHIHGGGSGKLPVAGYFLSHCRKVQPRNYEFVIKSEDFKQ